MNIKVAAFTVSEKSINKNSKHTVSGHHRRFAGGPIKIVSEYDQEIPQSQTADNPVAPRGRAAQP